MPYASWSYRTVLMGIIALRQDDDAYVPVVELAAYLARDYGGVLADVVSLTTAGCVRVLTTTRGVFVGAMGPPDRILHVA